MRDSSVSIPHERWEEEMNSRSGRSNCRSGPLRLQGASVLFSSWGRREVRNPTVGRGCRVHLQKTDATRTILSARRSRKCLRGCAVADLQTLVA